MKNNKFYFQILCAVFIFCCMGLPSQAKNYEITVDEPGQLWSKLEQISDRIVHLTIVGSLNAVDMRQIRHLENLRFLDLSQSFIVNNGDSISYVFFQGMSNLEWLSLPQNALRIGNATFVDCSRLRYAVLPVSLHSIGEKAFMGSKQLKRVLLPRGLKIIGNCAFAGCISLNNLDFPESLDSLGIGAFDGCSSLKVVRMPYRLSYLGSGCFNKCISLCSINLPIGIKSLDANTFYGCKNLKKVYGGVDLTQILYYCFAQCSNLKELTLLATDPPILKYNLALSLNQHCVLEVPIGTASKYLAADLWGEFKYVKEVKPFSISEQKRKNK